MTRWTKQCRVGVACAGIFRQPSYIADDQPFGVCDSCLIALLDLDSSDVCSCCGAGEDAYRKESILAAVKRIAAGEPIVPRYVALMWTYDIMQAPPLRYKFGIFDTKLGPLSEPVKVVEKWRGHWGTQLHKLREEAKEMSKEASSGTR